MGSDKRWLELNGKSLLESLLQKAAQELFAQKYLCVEKVTEELSALADQYGFILLTDMHKGAGPMEGLRRGLQTMTTEYALALSCDMPFFEFSSILPLFETLGEDDYWAVLPMTNGRRQPLAAVYHRDMAAKFMAALECGQHKIAAVVAGVPHRWVSIERADCFFNANTPADMRLVRGRMANMARETPIITVSAPVSNTGKTTFIEKLIPILCKQGVRTGVVKGDCHGYTLDIAGKDSWRFSEAGAQSVAVVSPAGYFIQHRTRQRASLLSVAAKMDSVDLVLIESRNHGTLPKFSLWRGLGEPIIDDDTVVLFTSEFQDNPEVAQYEINDMASAAEIVRFLMGREG